MLRAFGSISFILVVALSVAAQAQQPAAKEKSAAPGTISGRVLNESGQPVPNAVVYARKVGSGVTPYMVNTDREGTFQINSLDQAAYYVSTVAAAYIGLPHDPSKGPVPTYRPGDSVNLTLNKGGAVTGTVLTSTGEPVVGIAVRVQMIRDMNGREVRGSTRESATDDRGIYRVYGLITGTYIVSAGGPTESSNSFMNAFEYDVATYAPSSTRETAAEISVRMSEEVGGIDIRYRAEPGRTISGDVEVSAPNSSYTVTLVAAGDTAARWHTNYYQSSENKGFVINGIADGDYDIYASFYSEAESGVSEQKRISVRGADVSGIVLTTKLFGSVAGRLVVEEARVAECTDKELPVFNETMVSAWHNENAAAKRTPQTVWSMGTPTAPNAEGNFLLKNLAAGEYFFAARTQAKFWYLRSVSFMPPASAAAKTASKPVDATRVWTTVKPGDKLSGVTLTFAHGAAALRGKLGEGEPMPPRLFVYLVPAERERAEEVLRFFGIQMSPEAKFAFNNVPPGRYWILAQPPPENEGQSPTRHRFPHEAAFRARLRRDAEVVKNEIELKPCQTVPDFQLSLKPVAQGLP
jgi:hypothetical protein